MFMLICCGACGGGCVSQVFILDALVNYQVQDSKDAEKIVERVLPRLQHVNSAVVLSAAKVRRKSCFQQQQVDHQEQQQQYIDRQEHQQS
jgi:vesicle coat complex subunit